MEEEEVTADNNNPVPDILAWLRRLVVGVLMANTNNPVPNILARLLRLVVGVLTANTNNPDDLVSLNLIRRIKALECANLVGMYTMWNVMTYLANVWGVDLTYAAAILNMYWGFIGFIPIALRLLADTIMSNYWMLLLSSLAYCLGLGFLSMSTPPVLGKCGAYNPECIGDEQRILFYIALALTAVGMSGQIASQPFFLAKQVHPNLPGRDYVVWGMYFLSVIAMIVTSLVEWKFQFGVTAIWIVVATLLFLSGSCSYEFASPQGSPLTSSFRVFVAAASKMFYRLPDDPDQLYEDREHGLRLVPHTRTLRCLDKGAIIVQQNESKWRLCRVTEIEETKMLVRLIPVSMTFIMCGVVLSVGDTYFIEQADKMNKKVGKLHVPIEVLLGFYVLAKFVSKLGKTDFRFEIPASMILSILCCITAAKVEARRLHILTGLHEDHDEIIPMTIFWLAPQFLLLGALRGLSNAGFIHFFKHHIPQSMREWYFDFFAEAVHGVGYFGAVLSVYVVGKISKRGGTKPSWFQNTLNQSRLDKYYWTLAVMCAVNLILYILASIWHGSWKVKESEDIIVEDNPQEDLAVEIIKNLF